MWFHFRDSYSGGGLQTDYTDIYIEADCKSSAVDIFIDELGVSPEGVSCPCCGCDFDVYEYDDPPDSIWGVVGLDNIKIIGGGK